MERNLPIISVFAIMRVPGPMTPYTIKKYIPFDCIDYTLTIDCGATS